MNDTEWFSGRSADEPETPSWSRVVIEILCMACLGVLIAVALPGCATTKDAEVCYVKPMGETDGGLFVVLQQCLSPETFQRARE